MIRLQKRCFDAVLVFWKLNKKPNDTSKALITTTSTMVSIYYVQSATFLNSPFPSPASGSLRRGASSPQSLRVTASRSSSYDVVVVGGGIIGLTIARQFLTGSDLSVAVVDKAVPCSGATGAGKSLTLLTYFWKV